MISLQKMNGKWQSRRNFFWTCPWVAIGQSSMIPFSNHSSTATSISWKCHMGKSCLFLQTNFLCFIKAMGWNKSALNYSFTRSGFPSATSGNLSSLILCFLLACRSSSCCFLALFMSHSGIVFPSSLTALVSSSSLVFSDSLSKMENLPPLLHRLHLLRRLAPVDRAMGSRLSLIDAPSSTSSPMSFPFSGVSFHQSRSKTDFWGSRCRIPQCLLLRPHVTTFFSWFFPCDALSRHPHCRLRSLLPSQTTLSEGDCLCLSSFCHLHLFVPAWSRLWIWSICSWRCLYLSRQSVPNFSLWCLTRAIRPIPPTLALLLLLQARPFGPVVWLGLFSLHLLFSSSKLYRQSIQLQYHMSIFRFISCPVLLAAFSTHFSAAHCFFFFFFS